LTLLSRGFYCDEVLLCGISLRLIHISLAVLLYSELLTIEHWSHGYLIIPLGLLRISLLPHRSISLNNLVNLPLGEFWLLMILIYFFHLMFIQEIQKTPIFINLNQGIVQNPHEVTCVFLHFPLLLLNENT
jgi:hypothetical protein